MSEITIQIDDQQRKLLEEVSAREAISVSQVVARLLEQLKAPAPALVGASEEGELTMEAWMDKYCGIAEHTPPDLSSNPKYLEGLGKV